MTAAVRPDERPVRRHPYLAVVAATILWASVAAGASSWANPEGQAFTGSWTHRIGTYLAAALTLEAVLIPVDLLLARCGVSVRMRLERLCAVAAIVALAVLITLVANGHDPRVLLVNSAIVGTVIVLIALTAALTAQSFARCAATLSLGGGLLFAAGALLLTAV